MGHHSGTDQTTITFEEGKFVVSGWGGYDGHVKRKFDQIEDALDYVAVLWKLNTGTFEFNRDIVNYDKKRLIKANIRKWLGG
jgi:hypothetical protein